MVVPRDLIHQVVVGRDPTADDAVVALMADDGIGLTEGLIANDADGAVRVTADKADDDLAGSVMSEPADAEFDGGVGEVLAFEPEAVAGNFPSSGSGSAADEVTDGGVCGGPWRAGESGTGTGAAAEPPLPPELPPGLGAVPGTLPPVFWGVLEFSGC